MKVRLTKKRLRALNTALSLDDVLYEKFRRLNDDLDRQYRRLFKAERIVRVVQRKGEADWLLPILEIRTTPEGTLVTVG